MKPIIVYPLPLDNWDTFRPDVERFVDTLKEFPPGHECELWIMACGGFPTMDQWDLFADVPADLECHRYDGAGCDIGAHQHAAFEAGDSFMVNLSTRVHFHRAGWLAKMVEIRDYFGPGLFGTAVSNETGKMHFRTHCYGIEASEFRQYPHLINTRDRTFFFEHGAFNNPDGPLLQWALNRKHMAVACCYWNGGWRPTEWFHQPDIFRIGDQKNLLVFDRHTALFDGYTPEEKTFWAAQAYPPPPPPPGMAPKPKCCGQK